ncbi:MAG: hypothetical protein ACK5H2_13725 [Beutenbergiaceae bacterium]
MSLAVPVRSRHPLDGDGVIVTRARAALRRVAGQFGEVTGVSRTSVEVGTDDGLALTLSYDRGNYVFSRVYNLSISMAMDTVSAIPGDVGLSSRARSGPRYTSKSTGDLQALNAVAADHLRGIDVLRSQITRSATSTVMSLTPMGGSFVWVLIPPVFKATAFPPGEPDRIVQLFRAVDAWTSTL